MTIEIKKVLPGIIFLAIGIISIVALFVGIDIADIVDAIARLTFLNWFTIAAFTFAAIFVVVWRNKIILRSQGVNIPYWKIFFMRIAGIAVNYFTPLAYVGEEGTKIYLLNQHFKVSGRSATVYVALDRLFEVTASLFVLFLGVMALIFYLGFSGLTTAMLTIIFLVGGAAVLLGMFYFVLFKHKKVFSNALKLLKLNKTRFAYAVSKIEQDMLTFFNPRLPYIWKALFLSIVKQFIQIARQAFIIFALGHGFQIGISLMSLSALYLSYTIPIPASLGVQEAFQSILFALFGWKAAEGLAVSLILRSIDVFVVAVGAIALLKYGTKTIAQTFSYLWKHKT
jgi:uncharacterized protein (TIRG00374 family)